MALHRSAMSGKPGIMTSIPSTPHECNMKNALNMMARNCRMYAMMRINTAI